MDDEPPAIAMREYEDRIQRVREHMRASGVELALFDEIESLTWLAGYGNSMNRWRCLAVPVDAEPFILIRALDAGPCRAGSWVRRIETFLDWDDPMEALRVALEADGRQYRRIGLDFTSSGMNLKHFAMLRAALPGSEFVDLGTLVWELRLRKSATEAAYLRRAAGVADACMEHAARLCVPGARQKRLGAEMSMAYVAMGADIGPPGPISAADGDDFLHASPSNRPLAEGDIVHVELTPRFRGYSARLMRCVAVGAPSPLLSARCATVAGLQDRQIDAMKPGAVSGEVDAVLRDGLAAAGLGDPSRNITGYTLGFYANAATRTSDFTRTFHPGAVWRIEPGQVFHMYVGAAGVSLSETVLITDQGPERLTRTPRTILQGG